MSLLRTPRGRCVLFTLLYASEGAPIGFIWWTLPTLMREQGGGIGRITSALALVTVLWALKFLWAPFVDVLRGPRWGLRSWILMAQAFMGATLLPLVWLDPVADLPWLLSLLILHAGFATIQDVAIDALAIRTVPVAELGRINGFMAAGKYLGRGLFGGVALILAARLGWQWIILGTAGAIWVTLIVVWKLPEDAGNACVGPTPNVANSIAAFFQSVRRAFSQKVTWYALGFALLAGAGFEAVGVLTGTFLPDRGLSVEEVGWYRSVVVLGVMIAGAVVGGLLTDRFGARRASAFFLLLLIGGNMALSVLERMQAGSPWLLGWIAFIYFGYGLFVSGSYALFMSVTDRALAGTQFSLFMAATNGCEVWSGWLAGQIAGRAGYAQAFFFMGALSVLGWAFLFLLGKARCAVKLNVR